MRLALGLALTGCDGLLNNDQLPPELTDPKLTQSPAGALAAYHGTVAQFSKAFGARGSSASRSGEIPAGSFIAVTGLLSDELVSNSPSIFSTPEDRRTLPEPEKNSNPSASTDTYSRLQKVRGQAGQAIGLLTRYRPEEPALAGRVYALQGYAELFLAELFCSGIPLSTVDFDGNYTLQPGSSTEQVLAHARALFDTALALAGDSVQTVHLAHVGQARAFLASGRVAEAAAVAALVPDGYRDTLTYAAAQDTAEIGPNFALSIGGWQFSVADREGGRGLDYVTSADPRTPVTSHGPLPGRSSGSLWYPARYATDGTSPLTVASGLEARLIEAEAALAANPGGADWLDRLNALRTDGTQGGGGTYNPGTGGVAGLAPLTDPGTDSARVSLVFRERAFWLFLTGHRQGDLRRLLRQYKQYWPTPDRVYPIGTYLGNQFVSEYGSDVTAPIPRTEQLYNQRFTGCFARQA